MKKKIFIAAAILISSSATAQNETKSDSLKSLQEVIVTANKIEQKQEETGKVLTVISQEELQRSVGRGLGEILNQQVGIHIGGANGTPGSVQTIYTRGAAAANTLILLDGVPLYDASGISSEFDLNSFATDQVEKIEILKGAQSTLYGSDAVAGVINIITKKSSGKKVSVGLDASAGSYNTYRGGVNVSGSSKRGLEYFAGYSKVYSDGFSSAYDATGKQNFDDDGFKQDAVLASIGFKPVEKLKVRLYGKYNINKAEIDAGAFTDDTDYRYRTRNATAGTNLTYLLEKTSLHFNYNFNDYEREYKNDSINIGGFDTSANAFYTKFIDENYRGKSHFFELYGNINLHKNINLVTGVDYRRQATSQQSLFISNFGPFKSLPLSEDTANSNQASLFASLLFKSPGGFSLAAGGRINDHSIYGNNTTFSVNPSYTFKKTKVFANISSAYRVPSLYQLYSEYGNKELKPEESVNYEAGIQYASNIFSGRIVGFRRNIKDVFVFFSEPAAPYRSFYINEDRQEDQGVELESSVMVLKQVKISANYTYVTGEIATKDFGGKDTTLSNLYRRPKNTLNFNAAWTASDKFFVSSHVRSVSSFYEPKFGAAPVQLKGYYTWDVYASYVVSKSAKAFVDFRNVTDQLYFDQEGFGTRRFNMNAGINLRL